MLKVVEERFVKSYVRVCYLFGSNLSHIDKNKIIEYFINVYDLKIDNKQEEIMNFLIENDFNLNDVNLFLRRCQYKRMTHYESMIENSLELDLVTAISEEIKLLNSFKITNEGMKISLVNCFNILDFCLKSNHTVAYFIYATLYNLGIFIDEDVNKANEYLIKISHWNDIDAMLCLSYNKKDLKEKLYWYKLVYLLGNQKSVSLLRLEQMEKELGKINTRKVLELLKHDIPLFKLITDERSTENVNMNKYNSSIEKVIFYGNFSIIEKQTLIFSKIKIDFSKIELLVIENKKIKNKIDKRFIDFRKEEVCQLVEILDNMKKNKHQFPLVLIVDNHLLIDLYKSFIRNYLVDYAYINIDAQRTDPNLLLRQVLSTNIFYQEIVNKQNTNLLIISENIHLKKELELSLFSSYLDPSYKYTFMEPIITLDKSDFINIIFTKNTQQLDSKLLSMCKVFELAKIKKNEYLKLISLKLSLELKKQFTEEEYNKIAEYIIANTSSDKFLAVINCILSTFPLTNRIENVFKVIDDFNKNGKTEQIGFVKRGDNNESN